MLHKHPLGWLPCRDKVCPWAEPLTEVSSCRAVPEEPKLHPSPGSITSSVAGSPMVLGMQDSQHGAPHPEPNTGFGRLRDVALVQTDVPFLFSPCPCARHYLTPASRPGLPSSILLQLNPAPVLLQPLSAPRTLGRGGEEETSTGWGDRGSLRDHRQLVAGEFPVFLWAPVKGTQNPRRWEGPSGFQPGFWGQARWEPQFGAVLSAG